MSVFKCKMCGGTLEIGANQSTAVCEYCGTRQTLPRLADDRRSQMYDRANHFRRNNDFDKAMGIYEQILNEDSTDAEAYWSIVLCRYGIEYVEDPASHRRVPTVNLTQFTSIFEDEDYKSALAHADSHQKALYEEEANAINEIQKGILTISQKEKPFDIFICYKETDNTGKRTQDSVLANDLYYQLTQEGFKVFFSRITLEEKLGTAYEPYIFAALNSARVMVVIGTRREYFNAVWVKNEWSRYLALIKNGAKKVLIPAYRDMDPYDLPEEFSHLQALDMGKLGFMQDLIRGIKKLTESDTPKTAAKQTAEANSGADTAPLLRRAFLYLEDSDWENADRYCERVLDLDPENGQAYLGKLLAELKLRRKEDLEQQDERFDDSGNYAKVVRFGSEALCSELKGYLARIDKRKEDARRENLYWQAKEWSDQNNIVSLNSAIPLYKKIPGYKDADERAAACEKKLKELQAAAARAEEERQIAAKKVKKQIRKMVIILTPTALVAAVFLVLLNTVILPAWNYRNAFAQMEAENYTEAIAAFTELGDYRDSREQISAVYYEMGIKAQENGDLEQACSAFLSAGDYRDAAERIRGIYTVYYEMGIKAQENGDFRQACSAFLSAGDYQDAEQRVRALLFSWNVRSIAAGLFHTVGLRVDGTVVATGSNEDGQRTVAGWRDIVAIAAGGAHTVGLRADGTVIATGSNEDGQCDVEGWSDIVAIAAGGPHTVGLRADGTVIATGSNAYQRDVEGWSDIVAIAMRDGHTVGLRADGTVVATGSNGTGQCDVEGWSNIVAIAAGDEYTVGLRADGTVIATGYNGTGQCDVEDWSDIVAITTGYVHTVGLRADGTVIAAGYNGTGQCDVDGWTNIKLPS